MKITKLGFIALLSFVVIAIYAACYLRDEHNPICNHELTNIPCSVPSLNGEYGERWNPIVNHSEIGRVE